MGKWRPQPDQTTEVPPRIEDEAPMSFVVRIWRHGEDGTVRGSVEDVETGAKTAFLGLDGLKEVVSDHLSGGS